MKKIILSAALIVAGFTCSFAASVEDMAKDALINGGSYEVMGTFGAYDFEPKGDNDKFDWAFTMNGKSYQLRGNQPSDTDVFGWKPVDIVAPTPAWYMFQVDVDGDGTMGKFDWVLLGASSNYATKLKGVADNGSFDYTGKLDVDYKV
ncbi:MAG: hypothetical protein U9P71_09415, partial [Campylobacterota bacterium]|nr:hypothetical protein [Campylobacterota bacterium]